jgi:hypothetical protein
MTSRTNTVDFEQLEAAAKGFVDRSERLKDVSKFLQQAAQALKGDIFIGLPGAAALGRYIDHIHPAISTLAQKCEARAEQLRQVVANLRGDNA